MPAVTELDELLSSMKPQLLDIEFVFCTVSGSLAEYVTLEPIATFVEAEGLTLVLKKDLAQVAGFDFEASFRQITLTVYSSRQLRQSKRC